jgi:hypothetical protein
MKKQSTFLIVALPLLVLFFSACRKPEPEPVYTPLDPEFKAWAAYKLGSWWMYKETNSGVQDSIWVTEYTEQKFDGDYENNYWEFWMRIQSSIDSFGLHHYNGKPSIFNDNFSTLGEVYNYFNSGYQGIGRLYFPYTFPNELLPAGITITLLDSIVLSGSGDIYYNIYKITNAASEYGNWIKTEYWARNIGVVRREMFNGEIWELENYFIVQ